jgi:CHRD domain/Secretion system C-terminal sorting domain
MKKTLLLISTLFVLISSVSGITFRENLLFTSKLTGADVVPAVVTNAKGLSSIMLNRTMDTISINMSFIELSSAITSVKIYAGAASSNGSLILDLSPNIGLNRLATKIGGAVVKTNISNFMKENLYLVVTTTSNPTGELGGQIILEKDWNFVSDLAHAETLPLVGGSSYGLGSFNLSLSRAKLDFRIVCQNMNSAITGAILHYGKVGSIGSIALDISSFVNGNVIFGSIVPSSNLVDSLLSQNVYLNIKTANNPTGELRKQLAHYKGLTFDASLSGTQMVPPLTNNGKGVCIIRLSPALDSLYFDAVLSGLSSSIDYAHLHIGNAGTAYGALQIDFSSGISGNRIKGKRGGSAISTTLIKRLLTSNLSLVVHTTNLPTGELRGQVIRYAREGLSLNLNGAQVVPISTSSAYGTGVISVGRDEDNAHYAWLTGGLSNMPIAAHLNKNVSGQNGAILLDMSSSMTAIGTSASDFGFWKSTDVVPFFKANSIQLLSDSVYLEVANASFPNGEIRGQALTGQVYYVPTAIENLFPNSYLKASLSPNPAKEFISIQATTISSGEVEVYILDILGKIEQHYSYQNKAELLNTKLDISNLSSGIYMLTISNKAELVAEKFVKE